MLHWVLQLPFLLVKVTEAVHAHHTAPDHLDTRKLHLDQGQICRGTNTLALVQTQLRPVCNGQKP